MPGENLSYVLKAWLDSLSPRDRVFYRMSEVFDDFVIIKDGGGETSMVPYVGSASLGRAVFGKPEPITVDYFFISDETLVSRLQKESRQLSRPASGKACLLTLASGETISVVTEGYLDEVEVDPDILHYTLEEG